MSKELKAFVINMKSLDQDIEDPILAGAGDANGRTLRVIFTQEAAAQFTPETKVYLKWYHQQKDVKGLNIFSRIDHPCKEVWEINWPKNMLFEGDVLCNIEIVDSISIAPSTNFHVHVLADPNDGSGFVVSDDYSLFQQAVIDLTTLGEQAAAQLEQQKQEFETMKSDFASLQKDVNLALEKSNAAYDMAKQALDNAVDKESAMALYIYEYE